MTKIKPHENRNQHKKSKPIAYALITSGIVMGTVLATSPIMALDAKSKSICAGNEQLATNMMEFRQAGGTMSRAMAINDKGRKENPKMKEFYDMADALVVKAYKKPRFNTDKYRKNAAINFGNTAYSACIKALGKK